MFENLGEKLGKIFDKLKGKGFLSEDDINDAAREIRIALLEADVSISVVKDFIAKIKEEAVGREIVKSVSPGQMVVKIVNDELTKMLKSEDSELNLNTTPPAVIMMVGLQGSGKTTTSAKIALKLKSKQNKKVLLVSLDVARPAAQEQLEVLAKQINTISLPIIKGQTPIEIAKRAMDTAKAESYDLVIFDTAGRLHVDDELMSELSAIEKLTNPIETLLVADSMTGQDAINVAKAFKEKINITGIILTRVDGDSRGGAALSMKAVTGCPIKFLGSGEKLSELEEFHSDRIASRILGMGDIVSLVEKAAEAVNNEEAEKMAKKLQKGSFDLNDLAAQIKSIKTMGGIDGIMSMMPGMGKLKSKIPEGIDSGKIIARQEAIISSMTKKERKNPKLLNGSRKRRVAQGAGVSVTDVNKLLKQYEEMSSVIKKISKMDKKSLLRGGLKNIFS